MFQRVYTDRLDPRLEDSGTERTATHQRVSGWVILLKVCWSDWHSVLLSYDPGNPSFLGKVALPEPLQSVLQCKPDSDSEFPSLLKQSGFHPLPVRSVRTVSLEALDLKPPSVYHHPTPFPKKALHRVYIPISPILELFPFVSDEGFPKP